jgi:hypothetical protein
VDLFRGSLSWRKFAVLVRMLPDDSRTVTAQIDATRDRKDKPKSDGLPGTPRWSQENWQLHAIREELRYLQYTVVRVATAVAGGKKTGAPPKPLPTPVDRRKPRVASADKAALWRHLTAQLKFEGTSNATEVSGPAAQS